MTAQEQSARQQPSPISLVLYGILIGCYALYSWVWFSWAQFYGEVNAALAERLGMFAAVVSFCIYWLTPLAPALWFMTTTVMHPLFSRKNILWLLLGLVALVPLPFFFTQGSVL